MTHANKPGFQARLDYFHEQRFEEATSSVAASRQGQLQVYRKRQKAVQAQNSAASNDPHAVGVVPSSAKSVSSGSVGVVNWYPLGPSVVLEGQAATYPPISGRVTGIAVSADGQTIYVGAANGGVWRSTDGGQHWYPTMNAFNLQPGAVQSDSLAVGAVAVNPNNPQQVFVGSGEGGNTWPDPNTANAGGTGYWGVGPVVSSDGGNTWMVETQKDSTGNVSFEWADVAFYKMAVDPNLNSRVLAATTKGIYVRDSRNQGNFPANGFQPQSYMYRLNPTDGALNISYWRQDISDSEDVVALGGNPTFTGFDTPVSFSIEGVPYILMYAKVTNNGRQGGSYLLYYIKGDGTPTPATRASGTWEAGLEPIPFSLNGEPHMLLYAEETGISALIRWQSEGTYAEVQNGLVLRPYCSLSSMVIMGFPYLFAYYKTNGAAFLYRWEPNGMLTLVMEQQAGTWPRPGQQISFSLNDNAYFLLYKPDDGSFIVSRIQDNFNPIPTYIAAAHSGDEWQANLQLLPLSFNNRPYLLTYNSTNSALKLYRYDFTGQPVEVWEKNTPDGFTATPFLMGFEWNLKLPQGKKAGDSVTDMVVTRNGPTSTFFAAFSGDGVYSSVDGGSNWTLVGNNNQTFNKRISLAVQAQNGNALYALDQIGVVYRITAPYDSSPWGVVGDTPSGKDLLGWDPNNPDPNEQSPGQGSYDLVISVSPTDASKIFLGGSGISLNDPQWSASLWRLTLDVCVNPVVSKDNTYIGNSVHADMHAWVFDPSDNAAAWVGSDGGVYYTQNVENPQPFFMFQPRNSGLSTMTQERMGQNQDHDAVMFGSSQDNGCQRYIGNEAWKLVTLGDSGAVVVNWNDTKQVINTYVRKKINISNQYGDTNSFVNSNIPDLAGDSTLFYAPMIGTPKTTGAANRLAFGSRAPWISDDFGQNWQSIPKNNTSDMLSKSIRSLAFSADGNTLFTGTLDGKVYKYSYANNAWKKKDITNQFVYKLPSKTAITGIAVDTDNASIWITYGGAMATKGYRRVWYYNSGTDKWEERSGSGAHQLLDVQYNSIITGPGVNELWAAADIGIWHSTDGGANWDPKGDGLPEAAVLDLHLFPADQAIGLPLLVRATTYGRGTYELILSDDNRFKKAVQLYIRDTPLDRGIYPTIDGLVVPTGNGTQTTNHRNGPDIKLVIANDSDEFYPAGAITFTTFSENIRDRADAMKVQKLSRIYVQVHNRGPLGSENTRVRFIISTNIGPNANTAPTANAPRPDPRPPALPNNMNNLLATGAPLLPPVGNNPGWHDLGTQIIPEVITGVPKVAMADIPLNRLPTAGVYCVMAFTYQADDSFDNNQTDPDSLAIGDPKVAMKYLTAAV